MGRTSQSYHSQPLRHAIPPSVWPVTPNVWNLRDTINTIKTRINWSNGQFHDTQLSRVVPIYLNHYPDADQDVCPSHQVQSCPSAPKAGHGAARSGQLGQQFCRLQQQPFLQDAEAEQLHVVRLIQGHSGWEVNTHDPKLQVAGESSVQRIREAGHDQIDVNHQQSGNHQGDVADSNKIQMAMMEKKCHPRCQQGRTQNDEANDAETQRIRVGWATVRDPLL